MSEISWFARYSIHIDNIDEEVAFHLRKAIKSYMINSGVNAEIIASFEQIIDACETITRIDEGD